jgi:hypothetical protein
MTGRTSTASTSRSAAITQSATCRLWHAAACPEESYLDLFDSSTETSLPERGSTTTALQALYLMNSELLYGQSQRIASEVPESAAAFEAIFGRRRRLRSWRGRKSFGQVAEPVHSGGRSRAAGKSVDQLYPRDAWQQPVSVCRVKAMIRRQAIRSLASGGLLLPGILSELLAGEPENPLAPKAPHFKPKAKRVIFLFMTGGVSHIDSFDPKPYLTENHGKPAKAKSFYKGADWKFKRYGKSGVEFRTCSRDGQRNRRHLRHPLDEEYQRRSFGATIGIPPARHI